MSLSAAALRLMAAKGLSIEDIIEIAECCEAKSSGAERQARYRERKANRNESDVTRDVTSGSFPSSNGFPPDPLSLTTPLSPEDDEEARETVCEQWPEEKSQWISEICRRTGCAEFDRSRRDAWPLSKSSVEAVMEWNRAKVPWALIIELIPGIMARKRDGPPRSFAYFTPEILQAHVNRLRPVTLPEASNDQYHPPRKTAGERNQDSTINAFRRVFGGASDGEEEPICAPGRQAVS